MLGNVGTAYSKGRAPVVRHNFINCAFASGISSQTVRIKAITYDGNDAIVETSRPHNRTIGQNVYLNSVGQPELQDGKWVIVPSVFSGEFQVTGLGQNSGVELRITKPANAPTNAADLVVSQGVFNAFIGVSYNGPAGISATGCVTEGNAVYDCAIPYYTDTGGSLDAVVRDNYNSNAGIGVFFNFPPGETGVAGGVSEPQSAGSLKRDPVSGRIAILKLPDSTVSSLILPLNIKAGDAVTIQGARIGGSLVPANTSYNGMFTVISISADARSFTYEMPGEPGQDADLPDGANPIQFWVRWQIRRFVYENNICDLYAFDSDSVYPPAGVGTYAHAPGPPYIFSQFVMRGNVIRHSNDVATYREPLYGIGSRGFRLYAFEESLIEGNLTRLSDPYPVHHAYSRTIAGFGNQTPSGQRTPLFEDVGGGGTGPFREANNLEDRIADALLWSLL